MKNGQITLEDKKRCLNGIVFIETQIAMLEMFNEVTRANLKEFALILEFFRTEVGLGQNVEQTICGLNNWKRAFEDIIRRYDLAEKARNQINELFPEPLQLSEPKKQRKPPKPKES